MTIYAKSFVGHRELIYGQLKRARRTTDRHRSIDAENASFMVSEFDCLPVYFDCRLLQLMSGNEIICWDTKTLNPEAHVVNNFRHCDVGWLRIPSGTTILNAFVRSRRAVQSRICVPPRWRWRSPCAGGWSTRSLCMPIGAVHQRTAGPVRRSAQLGPLGRAHRWVLG
jgi:hypothetical protein